MFSLRKNGFPVYELKTTSQHKRETNKMMMNVLRFVGSLELEFLIKIQESGEIQDRI